jgi:hypothetical protein
MQQVAKAMAGVEVVGVGRSVEAEEHRWGLLLGLLLSDNIPVPLHFQLLSPSSSSHILMVSMIQHPIALPARPLLQLA